MAKINSMLLCDFYKMVHAEMLPEGMTKSVSYFTPRMSRVDRWDKVVMFGLQAFIQEYLIHHFEENFFDRDEHIVVAEYEKVMHHSLDPEIAGRNRKKIHDLHRLGYLPIKINALPEGTMVPMRVPMFSIENTHEDFAWLPQALESLISAELWYPMICATVGKTYRDIVDEYYEKTCEDSVPRRRALGNFDFRGDMGLDAALKAGSGWCLSFVNSATVPIVPYLEDIYHCDSRTEEVAYGAVSTEHFVMCSNYAVDGDEETFLRRLLTEIYPNTSFSCVLDSYDYWNVIDNILPKLHNEIMAHNGCMLMRGDSGDCVEVVTKTVFKLWEQFGGTVNSKGYKVLDPHVKAIYGDSITIQRAEEIYKILEENGFAAQNVSLGVGSFSMHCIEENGELKPFTRDTFSSCIKACYAEVNGKEYPIFKNPKEGGFKKSQKGLCYVHRNEDGELTYEDGYTAFTLPGLGEMRTVFQDGYFLKEDTLQEIRERLHGGYF